MSQVVGYSAIILASISFLPQVRQIMKTKNVRDINFNSCVLNITSGVLYIIYGSMENDNVVILSVIMPICVQLLILYFIIIYKNTNLISDISNNQP